MLLGSSGAGKSTLTNTLLGSALQDTGPVRESDGRGMHTTTSRSLHRLPGGAYVIDTPGVRTLRADIDAATLAASFGDIERWPRTAVSAIAGMPTSPAARCGRASMPDRLRNYQKMLRESGATAIGALEAASDWRRSGRRAARRRRARMKIKRGEPDDSVLTGRSVGRAAGAAA